MVKKSPKNVPSENVDQKEDQSSNKADTTPQQRLRQEIDTLKSKADEVIKKIEAKRKRQCYVLWQDINDETVDEVYENLRQRFNKSDQLDVLVHSGGGDIDAAYNLACTFRKFAKKELSFIVPRWAKSAATLLVCAGEVIYMTQIAELGPLDPQITEINPMEERVEQFSPLHVKTTFDLIREEYSNGNKVLAEALLQRLQFPLTLGKFTKSL